MNIKEEKSREFLKFKKIQRDLKVLRFDVIGTDKAKTIDKMLALLAPIVQELDEWLTNANLPITDYDI